MTLLSIDLFLLLCTVLCTVLAVLSTRHAAAHARDAGRTATALKPLRERFDVHADAIDSLRKRINTLSGRFYRERRVDPDPGEPELDQQRHGETGIEALDLQRQWSAPK